MAKKRTLLTCVFALLTGIHLDATLIMIDPAGHAKQTGRRLWNSYERAETYQCAQALKAELEQRFVNVRVQLTRTPGDEVVPLQNASFANRLAADCFLRINFYKEQAEKSHMYLYHLMYDPIIDNAKRSVNPYSFIPIYQAHYQSIDTSLLIAQTIKDSCEQRIDQKLFELHTVYGLPLKPLVGIVAPAIILEMGLKTDAQWKSLITPLADSIGSALKLNHI